MNEKETDFFIKRNALDKQLAQLQETLEVYASYNPVRGEARKAFNSEINGIAKVRKLLCDVQAYTVDDIRRMEP